MIPPCKIYYISFSDICVILSYPIRIYNTFIKYLARVLNVEINYSSIGNRIKETRVKQHLTQARLAELSGVEPSNISHIERAATKVSLPTLISIANALGTSLDELVSGSLIKNEHICIKNIDELLSDCSAKELEAIEKTIKNIKTVLREFSDK